VWILDWRHARQALGPEALDAAYASGMNLSQRVAMNTVLLVGSRLAVAGSGLIGIAVVTRYLGPREFGQLTIAIVFVSLFAFLTDSGLWTVAAREIAKRPEEERSIIANAFTMSQLATVGVVAVAGLFVLTAYAGADRHLVRIGILIMGIQILVAPLGGTVSSHMVARQRALPAAVGAVLSSLVFLGLLAVVISQGLGFAGVAACFAITGPISYLTPLLFARRTLRVGLAFDLRVWRQMLGWAVPQAGVLLLGALYFRFDAILLSLLRSDAQVGLYGVCYRVIDVLTLLPTYLMITVFPEIARQQAASARVRELVQGAVSSVLLAVIPICVLLLVFAPEVVEVAGGPRFAAATAVLRILLVAIVPLYVNTVFFSSLVALDQQGRLFRWLLATLALNVLLNLALIPALGARGAALALVVTESVALALGVRLYRVVGAELKIRGPGRLALATMITAAAAIGLRAALQAAGGLHVVGGLSATTQAVLEVVLGGGVTMGIYLAAVRQLRAIPDDLVSALRAVRHPIERS